MRLPTRLDRYPAKMVSTLADRLIERYALGARRLLDPFCGSGAILVAAQHRGIPVTGIDINPVADVFCRVKLNGFRPEAARRLAARWIEHAEKAEKRSPVVWPSKSYWFTPATMEKFERLRGASAAVHLAETDEGMAVLMSYVLAVRLCSRADQRSPKPFISKQARFSRKGRHFDPCRVILDVLDELGGLYGVRKDRSPWRLLRADVPNAAAVVGELGSHSHIVTSPPYINAQDYFRNFKLELYLLEGVLPYRVTDIRERFIGTERGNLLGGVARDALDENLDILPELEQLQRRDSRLAGVVHRYLDEMRRSFDAVTPCLPRGGRFVLVCGDNLVGGLRIPTWRALQYLLERKGLRLFDRFADKIGDRLLAPKRHGHRGLIKQEMILAFSN